MTFDRAAYQRDYMAKRRAAQPASEKARMRKALETVRDELVDTKTEKGLRLLALVKEALGSG